MHFHISRTMDNFHVIFSLFVIFILQVSANNDMCDLKLAKVFRTPKDFSKVNFDHMEILERNNFDAESENKPCSANNIVKAAEQLPKSIANAQVMLRFGGDNIRGRNKIEVPDKVICRSAVIPDTACIPQHPCPNYNPYPRPCYPPHPHPDPHPSYAHSMPPGPMYYYPPPPAYPFPNYYHCPNLPCCPNHPHPLVGRPNCVQGTEDAISVVRENVGNATDEYVSNADVNSTPTAETSNKDDKIVPDNDEESTTNEPEIGSCHKNTATERPQIYPIQETNCNSLPKNNMEGQSYHTVETYVLEQQNNPSDDLGSGEVVMKDIVGDATINVNVENIETTSISPEPTPNNVNYVDIDLTQVEPKKTSIVSEPLDSYPITPDQNEDNPLIEPNITYNCPCTNEYGSCNCVRRPNVPYGSRFPTDVDALHRDHSLTKHDLITPTVYVNGYQKSSGYAYYADPLKQVICRHPTVIQIIATPNPTIPIVRTTRIEKPACVYKIVPRYNIVPKKVVPLKVPDLEVTDEVQSFGK